MVRVIDDDGRLNRSTRASWTEHREIRRSRNRRVARSEHGRGKPTNYRPARLELLAAALLGLPDPDHLLSGARRRPRIRPAVLCPRWTTTGRRGSRRSPPTPISSTRRARSAADQAAARPTRWTASTRPGIPALHRSENDQAPFDREIADYWMRSTGTRRHRSREGAPALFALLRQGDERLGMLGFREPFQRLFHQGWVRLEGKRMSKSQGGVSPNELIDRFGADAVRIYMASRAGRPGHRLDAGRDRARPWGHSAALAGRRTRPPSSRRRRRGSIRRSRGKAHETIARVSDDIDRRFASTRRSRR